MKKGKSRNSVRKNKHRRIRFTLKGTAEKPRLCVYKSNRNTFAQVIDDQNNQVLAATNTLQKDVRQAVKKPATVAGDKKLGELLAKKIAEKGIKQIVFDRSGYKYHGRVKAIAEGARATKLVDF